MAEEKKKPTPRESAQHSITLAEDILGACNPDLNDNDPSEIICAIEDAIAYLQDAIDSLESLEDDETDEDEED